MLLHMQKADLANAKSRPVGSFENVSLADSEQVRLELVCAVIVVGQ